MKYFEENIQQWAKTCPRQAVMLPYTDCTGLSFCHTTQGELNLRKGSGKNAFFYHSQEGALKEAEEWRQQLTLRKTSLVCVYGVGLGYYYEALSKWLKGGKQRHLVFLEDDLAVIHHLFQTELGSKILKDPKVQLLYFQDFKESEAAFDILYWNFAMKRLIVSGLNSYVINKTDAFSLLRHRIAYDAAMKNALIDEYLRYGVNFYYSFYPNMLNLHHSYLGNRFFGKFHNVPAIICGAGPSLEKNLPRLKTLLNHALVFAGGSALNVLNSAGFNPHFGAGIDPNPMQYVRLSANQSYEVPFFYRNRMYHDAFRMIHGPRLYITGSGGYDTAEYFEKKFDINAEFLDEGHNVVNFCVEIANAMGCNPIIFVGLDLAFTGMKQYAPGVIDDVAVHHTEILNVDDEDDRAIIKPDIDGNPTYTLWKWVAESEWIGNFAKEHPSLTMINCTEGGLGFPGIANRPFASVAKELLTKQYDLRIRVHGETQNSTMPQVTYRKLSKAMRELQNSLKRSLEHLEILKTETEQVISKWKESQPSQDLSALGILAETELAEEVGYQSVLDIFNEVSSRLLSRDLHEIHVKRSSEKQKRIQKLSLGIKKYSFLKDVCQINIELINHAFKQHRKQQAQKQRVVKYPKIPRHKSGTYSFKEGQLIIDDPECHLSINETFRPLMIPTTEQRDGAKVGKQHQLRLFFDASWLPSECYVEHAGQPDGEWRLYYPDGQTKMEGFYKKGELHGPVTFKSDTGIVLAKSWYVHGKQEGKSWWFYPSGELYSLQRFSHDLWHGHQEFYYPDGKLKTLLTYEHGVLTGEPLALNPNGTRARE